MTLIYEDYQIGLCVDVEKNVKVNEIAEFGGLNFFSLIVLSGVTIECVMQFGMFVKMLKNQWKW